MATWQGPYEWCSAAAHAGNHSHYGSATNFYQNCYVQNQQQFNWDNSTANTYSNYYYYNNNNGGGTEFVNYGSYEGCSSSDQQDMYSHHDWNNADVWNSSPG